MLVFNENIALIKTDAWKLVLRYDLENISEVLGRGNRFLISIPITPLLDDAGEVTTLEDFLFAHCTKEDPELEEDVEGKEKREEVPALEEEEFPAFKVF